MTRRDEITRDIERTASRFFGELTIYEWCNLRGRVRRLYAERDALTPAEAMQEAHA